MDKTKNKSGINLRVPKDLKDWLNKKAENKRVKLSQIIRDILYEKHDSEIV